MSLSAAGVSCPIAESADPKSARSCAIVRFTHIPDLRCTTSSFAGEVNVTSVIAESASGDALVDALAAHGRSLREQARAAGEELQRPSQTRTTGRRKSR